MCCCNKPSINGKNEYSWDGKSSSIRKPYFAELEDGDELIRDLPGRCGGIDSHSHDLRIVRRKIMGLYLLVHHGGGTERIPLHAYGCEAFIEAMSDNDCYWMMRTLHGVQSDAARLARDKESYKWRQAAAEKRIKTRKNRGSNTVKVWIEPQRLEMATNDQN